MWRLIVFLLMIGLGYWVGRPKSSEEAALFPIVEHKSFVFVVYAYNGSAWCEKTLRSIFEQDYDHYRVVWIDDGSVDNTYLKAKQYILDNALEEKVILIRNEEPQGRNTCLARAVDGCLDREIVVPLDTHVWLSSPKVLEELNAAYQNPDVWAVQGQILEYPSYQIKGSPYLSYYVFSFKKKEAFGHEKTLQSVGLVQGPHAFCSFDYQEREALP